MLSGGRSCRTGAVLLCGTLAIASGTIGAQTGLDALPAIGSPPPGTLSLFEGIRFEFSPPPGSTLADQTEMSEVVYAPATTGSFNFVVLFVRDDGALRVWGRGSVGSKAGGVGGKQTLAQLARTNFFLRGRRFDAAVLAQYSANPTGFIVRTRETPRCIFFNCFGDDDDPIVWERVHYRRLIPLNWRRN